MRLRKDQKENIIKEIREKGFKTGGGNNSNIFIWKNDHFIGSFSWITKLGWRLTLVSPIVYTQDDLTLALEEIQITQQINEEVNDAWSKYKTSPSEKNWQAYQGLLASFYVRQLPIGVTNGDSKP
jgi:hypothetical protein